MNLIKKAILWVLNTLFPLKANDLLELPFYKKVMQGRRAIVYGKDVFLTGDRWVPKDFDKYGYHVWNTEEDFKEVPVTIYNQTSLDKDPLEGLDVPTIETSPLEEQKVRIHEELPMDKGITPSQEQLIKQLADINEKMYKRLGQRVNRGKNKKQGSKVRRVSKRSNKTTAKGKSAASEARSASPRTRAKKRKKS